MDTPFDYKSVLKDFGTTDEQFAQLEKGELKPSDFISSITTNISNAQKERYLTDWDKEKQGKLVSDTQIGTYNSVKKKAFEYLKDLGITEEKFKDAKFEDILQEIPKRINESKAQYEERLKKAGADVQNIAQLQSQLDQMQGLAKEHEELKSKLPTLREEAVKEVKAESFAQDLKQKAFASIENIAPNIKYPFFQAYIDSMGIKIRVSDVEQGTYDILDKDGRFIQKKNPQFNYTDLKEFYTDIAKKQEGFIMMTDASNKTGAPLQTDPTKKTTTKIQSW